jgi:hypothetical protein
MYVWIADTRQVRRRTAAAAGVRQDVCDRVLDAFLAEMSAAGREPHQVVRRAAHHDTTGAFAPEHVGRGASAGRGH